MGLPMTNIPFSRLSIAVTLMHGASELITDAASYLERGGDPSGSRELYALGQKTQSAIAQIETKIRQCSGVKAEGADLC
jgi:hypothetical protein